MSLANMHILVYGLGAGGIASVKRLLKLGTRVTALDGKGEEAARAILHDCENDPNLFFTASDTTFDRLILAPGAPHRGEKAPEIVRRAIERNVPVVSEIEMFYELVRLAGSKARFVSVTGTNGKSTTTALTAFLLKECGIPCEAGGNLGPPAMALPILPDGGVYVLELSSYALERINDYRSDVAVWLNLTPDHLERHGDLEGYFQAKFHVFDRMNGNGLAIVGSDIEDRIAREFSARNIAARLRSLSGEGLSNVPPSPYLAGAHNLCNIEAACLTARYFGISDEKIASNLVRFKGLAHRMEKCGTLNGLHFINDSKATNAEASEPALKSLNDIYWIMGGVPKSGDIEILENALSNVKHIFVIGAHTDIFVSRLKSWGVDNFTVSNDLKTAFEQALEKAGRTDATILLSPSAASQDQYKNFEERGDRFKDLVTHYLNANKD